MSMAAKQLTARGVKAMLARSSVDHSQLSIADIAQSWTNLSTGERGTSVVRITGTKEARRPAFHALLDRGLSVAPYPEYDEWTRRP